MLLDVVEDWAMVAQEKVTAAMVVMEAAKKEVANPSCGTRP